MLCPLLCTLPPAKKLLLLTNSLMKSKPASKGSTEAARQAARRTFGSSQSLSLEPGSSQAKALQGRRRLSGAFFIELNRIRPDPTQPRRQYDEEALEELRASVRRFGLLQPISVRYLEEEDIYQIISGERRYRAAIAVGLKEVPCWEQNPDQQEILLRQVVENWQRSDLNPYELADALVNLQQSKNYSQKELAREIGKSESEVSRILSLQQIAPAAQKMAREQTTGELSRRHLFVVAQFPAEQQEDAIHTIKQQNMTAIETERWAKKQQSSNTPSRRVGSPPSRNIRYVVPGATVTLSFRRKEITREDIIEALQQALQRAVEVGESETATGESHTE